MGTSIKIRNMKTLSIKSLSRLFVFALAIGVFACEIDDSTDPTDSPDEDSSTVADGLKEALRVGTDTAVSILKVEDGYFADQAVKILLPDDIEAAINSLKSKSKTINTGIPFVGDIEISGADLYNGYSNSTLGINIESLQAREDDLILGINRAAEKAADDAAPIFVDAITGMTISDANDILFGDDTAATHYLRGATYSNLFTQFEPKIDDALNTVKINDESVAQLYEDYVIEYNKVVNTSVTGFGSIGTILGVNAVTEPDLSAFATNEGLDGLFLKVSDEEKNIRENPLARVTELLQSVFAALDI